MKTTHLVVIDGTLYGVSITTLEKINKAQDPEEIKTIKETVKRNYVPRGKVEAVLISDLE